MGMDKERKARLETTVATEWLRLAMEKMVATERQVGHGDGRRKKSKTGEDGSHHTAQVGPSDRGKKKKSTETSVR